MTKKVKKRLTFLTKSGKIEKKATKRCKKRTGFLNSGIGVKIGNPSGAWIFAGENSLLKMRLNKMLRWRRWEKWERKNRKGKKGCSLRFCGVV